MYVVSKDIQKMHTRRQNMHTLVANTLSVQLRTSICTNTSIPPRVYLYIYAAIKKKK